MLKEGNLRKATFTKPEGSQSGGVQIFSNSEGSQTGGVLFSQNLRGPKTCGVLYLITQRGSNLEGSKFSQSGGVSILPIRKCPIFANPEGYYFIEGLR